MASVTLRGNQVQTSGDLPPIGSDAPEFSLVGNDLADVRLDELAGKDVVLSISPSIDTGVCATSVREFNERAASLDNTVVVHITADLPFAQQRFCGAEGIENVITLSTFRDADFAYDYGVKLVDGPMAGLCTRAIVVIGTDGTVKYTELVPEITSEPDYDAALAAV